MSGIIEIRELGKQYCIGAANGPSDSFREVLMRAVSNPLRSFARIAKRAAKADTKRSIWALRDVSFDVEEGEIVGIIGRNGAGKSTLLKVLSRITEPTVGTVRLRGRLASLLEVGTGFHPELTGRENIFLNGAILGMRRAEIISKFDEIVDFAEIATFLDTPVKRYSSGMYVRLAFAVAAFLDEEILVVDEVLAVGDQGFQKKCLRKMDKVSKSGRTVLFVSHNMAAVESLCNRVLWISGGRVKQDASPQEVIHAYLDSYGAAKNHVVDLSAIHDRSGTGDVRFTKMELLDEDGGERCAVRSGDALRVQLFYECRRDISNLHFGLRIFSDMGLLITDVHTWSTGQAVPLARKGKGNIEVKIDFLNLMPGTYYVGIWASSFHEWHDVLDNAAKLEVEPSDYYGTGRGIESRFGLMFLPFQWIVNGVAVPAMATDTTPSGV
jgi:lipopolysaccharide transport system ATP-binding protein